MNQAPAPIWYEHVYAALRPFFADPCECKAVVQRLLSHYLGYDLNKHILGTSLEAEPTKLQEINRAIERLKHHEPIQYVLGEAPFLSYTLHVNPYVLIPRPETEEMVHAILQDNDLRGKRILDLCTGSGCIAIALKKACAQAVVDALDISADALNVAASNAKALQASIHWHQLDLLRAPLPAHKWDIVVSNPPYIPLHEHANMSPQVIDHEPGLALFVPDDNPYLFYERIAALAPDYLKKGGKVYAEFHERFADKVRFIFKQKGFSHVAIHRDLQGKERWLVASE